MNDKTVIRTSNELTDGESKAFDAGYDEGMQFGYAEGLKAAGNVPSPSETFERQPDSVPPELCTNPFCIGGITDDGLCERCGGTGNLPPAQKASEPRCGKCGQDLTGKLAHQCSKSDGEQR